MPEPSKSLQGFSAGCELYDAEPRLRTAYQQFLSDAGVDAWPLELTGCHDGYSMIRLRIQAPDGTWATHTIVRTSLETTIQAFTLFLWHEYGAWRRRAEVSGNRPASAGGSGPS